MGKVKAVVQVGLSFASIGIFENHRLVIRKQIYLPQEPLGNALKRIWTEFGVPNEILVNSHFIEKILDAKLGGSVAQIVTKGFETWPILRQPAWPDHFSQHSKRQSALASQDLIFGISGRISSEGKVLQELKKDELEAINIKLKSLAVKRVCVNLLFSPLYPDHQNQVAQYFTDQGYEVFAFPREKNSPDEMPAWRKNIINACLSGVFSEHVDAIKSSLGESESDIAFIDSQGKKFLSDKNQVTEGLFAWTNSLAQNFSQKSDHVLYLGLENWSLISTTRRSPYWDSPWGQIELNSPLFHRLKSQPTLEVVPGFWGGIDFSKTELGYEPGPMSFGRALKLTVYDLMKMLFSFELPQNNPQGEKRLKDHFNALIKNIAELREFNSENLAKVLISQLAFQIVSEAQFKNFSQAPEKSKTIVTGFYAPFLYSLIKDFWVSGDLILDPDSATCELVSTYSSQVHA